MTRRGRQLGLALAGALLSLCLVAGPGRGATGSPSNGEPGAADEGMPERFESVADGIFRSAQPTAEALGTARARGIRTLLVLRSSVPRDERDEAERLGLGIVHVPMGAEDLPSMEQVDRALDALLDPARRPILVHCRHGEERTGTVIAAYRVAVQGWTPAAAAREAEAIGFGFDGLERFLERYRAHRAAAPGSIR